jgi:alpha-tubulin suppressor-like RCC1 family protein
VQDQLRNVQQIQSARCGAFAAILADGSVVSWGDPDHGGDCSRVQCQLNNVQQIQAARSAFAAILADGSVVAWGLPQCGGDCSAVQDQVVQL